MSLSGSMFSDSWAFTHSVRRTRRRTSRDVQSDVIVTMSDVAAGPACVAIDAVSDMLDQMTVTVVVRSIQMPSSAAGGGGQERQEDCMYRVQLLMDGQGYSLRSPPHGDKAARLLIIAQVLVDGATI